MSENIPRIQLIADRPETASPPTVAPRRTDDFLGALARAFRMKEARAEGVGGASDAGGSSFLAPGNTGLAMGNTGLAWKGQGRDGRLKPLPGAGFSRPSLPWPFQGQDSVAGVAFQSQTLASIPPNQPVSGLGQPPPGPTSLHDLVVAAARQEGVPPAMLAAVVEQESGFNPRAVSRSGAKGLTQLMDGTAAGLGVTNPYDPWQSLVGGARFLHGLLKRYDGDVTLALAGYNAGPGAVDHAGRQVPPYPETQTYVRRVSTLFRQYAAEFSEEAST